jgi:Raf kinase inhibitor-like YbhB/YbcL family protein
MRIGPFRPATPKQYEEAVMKLFSENIKDGELIPARYAMGKIDPKAHAVPSENVNPQLAWSDVPAGTRSLVLLVCDVDAPADKSDANREDKVIRDDCPRTDFYHWVLIDLPPDASPLREGEFCKGITATGKQGPVGPRGTRQGLNNYTQWFEGDAAMEGEYHGYDGPWPPFNDERIHRYRFTLYAIDVEKLPLGEKFTGPDVLKAIAGHELARASLTGTYCLNPDKL